MHGSYAIVTKRASSTLRKARVPVMSRRSHREGEMFGLAHTHTHTQAPFSEGLATSPCSASSIDKPVVYSAEGARYRSAIVCVFAMGRKRTSCGLSLQRVWKRESAHESHVGMMSLMSLI